jgi:glycosylphosphatidylinositol transamidase (GPIT) subunit GPI8
MGLPGSGKTYLAQYILEHLQDAYKVNEFSLTPFTKSKIRVGWLNADDVRKKYNDWDFSHEGRIRQSLRMRELADSMTDMDYVICDFVAPLVEMRNNFKADWTIWVDTIDKGRFDDTNKVFIPPEQYDFRITEQNAEKWSEFIFAHLYDNRRRPVFDWQKETVQMLGRWQPWHEGHRKLFERAIAKTGQVVIQIRDCQGWQGSNPFAIDQVKSYIKRDLDMLYQGQYEIQIVPNIVNITYGRDVGYKIEQETFDDAIHSISATKIRKEMGLK